MRRERLTKLQQCGQIQAGSWFPSETTDRDYLMEDNDSHSRDRQNRFQDKAATASLYHVIAPDPIDEQAQKQSAVVMRASRFALPHGGIPPQISQSPTQCRIQREAAGAAGSSIIHAHQLSFEAKDLKLSNKKEEESPGYSNNCSTAYLDMRPRESQ